MIKISARKTPIFKYGSNSKAAGKIKKQTQQGFTLIEILIVIGLIGMIMGLAVPNAKLALKVNISNSGRDLATTIRAAYDEAQLKGMVHRVAFDFEKREYWVESGTRDFLMQSIEQELEEKRKLERKSEEQKQKITEPFALARTVTKKKLSLPKGVRFTEILTPRFKDPQTSGVVYVHIFPHGFVEKVMLHIKDDYDRESTLSVNSMTGKSRLFERRVEFKELETM